MFHTVAFIGLGLIGGSMARRLKEWAPETCIMAYMRTRSTLEQAHADGVVDVMMDAVDSSIANADLIILCTPVSYNEMYLEKIRPWLKKGALVTDVGSTKTAIHEAVIRLGMENCFVGGHPMAGSERTGYAVSRPNLLENAYYIITPTACSTKEQIQSMVEFASGMKAIPYVLDYRKHDRAVAAISHVPHLVAAGLVNLVADSDTEDQVMKRIAAGGFKDITRIASSSPVMWEQICETNSEAIIPLMEAYINELNGMVKALKENHGQKISEAFEKAGTYRSSISERGAQTLSPVYTLYCDIPDRSGAIAVVASLLSFENISIRNIGINHNRELMEGTLRIEFHDQNALELATECLTKHHFPVYPQKP